MTRYTRAIPAHQQVTRGFCRCALCRKAHADAARLRNHAQRNGSWKDKRKRSNTLLLGALDRSALSDQQPLQFLVNHGAAPQVIQGRADESPHANSRQYEPDPAVGSVTDAQPSRLNFATGELNENLVKVAPGLVGLSSAQFDHFIDAFVANGMLERRGGTLFLPGGPDTSRIDGLIGAVHDRIANSVSRSAA